MPMPIHFGRGRRRALRRADPTRIARPAVGAGPHPWGIVISIRHVIAAALLVSGALTLTACGPGDDGGKSDAKGSASSQPAGDNGDKGDKNDKGGDKGKGGGKSDCPTLAKGHKFIQVYSVTGAMNNVTAKDAKMACNSSMHEGAAYHSEGDYKTYHWKPGSKVTVIGKNGPEDRTKPTGDQLSGIGHVKLCADPERKGGNMATKPDTKEFCYGQNFYDVAVGSDDTITEMTELYGS